MRIFHGWYVVGCAFLVALWGWGLGFYGLGVYLVALQESHGWSVSTISGAITAYYLCGATFIAFLGGAMKRFGPVVTVSTGAGAMALGAMALTVITEPWQLYAAFLTMAAGWSTMSAAAVNVLVAPWFERRRGFALSLAFTGASCAGVVVGPGLLGLVRWLGFRSGVVVASAVMLATLLPVVSLVLRRRPDDLDVGPDGDARAPAASSAERSGGDSGARAREDRREGASRRAIRTLRYWTISIPFAAGLVAQVGFLTHQLAFLTPLVGSAAAGITMSLTALAAVAGRFALGSLIDRMDARLAACANFLVQVAGFALLVYRPSGSALYAGCLLVGLGVGNMVSLPGILIGRDFSRAEFAAVVSLVTATNQVTFAFAPAAVGLLRDLMGDYTGALGLCLGLDALAAAVVVIGRTRVPALDPPPSMTTSSGSWYR